LTPGDGGVPVTLSAGGTQVSTTTAADGTFAAQFTPGAGGEFVVTARARDVGTDLARGCTVPVAKASSSLTATCPATSVPYPGHDARVSGTLTPAVGGARVTVTFSQPGQPDVQEMGDTDAAGAYFVLFSPPAPGDWTAQAGWVGDAAHDGSSAPSCVVHVG
jgi:hypothetical protein